MLVVHWNSQQSDIGDLTLYTQDLLTGRWSIEPVRLASGARQVAVPCYRTQATLVDASGVPVPDYAMRLTARSYVQVNIAGTAHLLTPGSAVEIKTDRLGRAIFSTLAYGLTTPSLVLNAPALPDGVVIKPDGPVQNYLAGTGTLPLRPKLTGEVLRDAGVVPSWDGKPSPNDVVASIEDLFKAAAAKPLRSRNAGFMIQTFDPSRPAYRTFASREELMAELAQHRRHDLYGGLFDDLKMGLEDLWEGIKSGAAKIKQAVFDAVEGTIRFFIWIGGKVVELYKTVVQSFRDAADATMALFNQLDATIQSVVSWLQSMFNFKDIWDTKTALEVDGLKRFPDYIRAELLAKVPPASIKNHLNEYRAKALDGLQAFAKRFAGQKFQDLPGWSQLLSAQNHGREALLFASPQGTVRRTDIDNPQANWFLDSLLPYDAFVPEGPMVPSLEPAWAELRDALDKLDFSFAYEFKDRLVNLFDPKNADALGSIVLDSFVALLTWTLDKLFDLAIAIVEALFKVVDKTLRAMAQFLDTQVEFQPILDLVTWVYKQAHSKEPNPPPPPPVTLAGLVSLMVAFPATLAWKLAVGDPNRPLFPGGKLPQPGRGLTSDAATDGQRCLGVGGVIQAYYMFLDCANDTEPTHCSSVGAIVMELLMPMLIWPTPEGVPFTSKSSEEPLQQFFRWFNWAPGLVYVASDALFYLIGWNGKKQLARQVEPLGIMVLFSFGTINLIAGVGESVVTQPTVTGAGIAANVLSPLSPAAQILRISKNPYALAIKLAINVFSDMGGGIARGLAAAHSVP